VARGGHEGDSDTERPIAPTPHVELSLELWYICIIFYFLFSILYFVFLKIIEIISQRAR